MVSLPGAPDSTAAAALTLWIGWQAEQLHARLMGDIQATGLAQERDTRFVRGWLRSRSEGSLALAPSLCAACERLDYHGTLHQGVGTLLAGQPALALVDYRLSLPRLPLEPALPSLDLLARVGLAREPRLNAQLAAPPSQHRLATAAHDYDIDQQGLAGTFDGEQLHLQLPGLALRRDARPWLGLDDVAIAARAAPAVEVDGQVGSLSIPAWNWQARSLRLRYQQPELGRRLSFRLDLSSPGGTVAGRDHAASALLLAIDRLDLAATRAFAAELPRLLDPATSRAARMLGLLSLYGLHGPALFGAAPQLRLEAEALPLPEGPAEVLVDLRVRPGLTRPPMHPQQWRQALEARVDVQASPQRLAQWWALLSPAVHHVTGLPLSYPALEADGWIQAGDAGRARLAFSLQDGRISPIQGP